LTFLSDGKVGVGTTSPAGKFDVVTPLSSGAQTVNFLTVDNAVSELNIGNSAAGTNGRMRIGIDNSQVTPYAYWQTVSTTNPIVMQPTGGLVGIGTTTPSANFDVVASTNANPIARFYSTSSSGTGLEVRGGGGAVVANQFILKISDYNGNQKMYIKEDGNVGIGDNTTPGSSFSVKNNASIGSTYASTAAPANSLIVSGNVGIGTTSPGTALQVAGVITPAVDNTHTLGTGALRFLTVYAVNGAINTSDVRQKKNIQESDLGLDFINKLRPVSYNWKTGADQELHYGLIAQETEKVLMENRLQDLNHNSGIVDYDKKSDRYGIRYTELIAPIIKAVQELFREVKDLANKVWGHDKAISGVQAENAMLKARLDKADAPNSGAYSTPLSIIFFSSGFKASAVL
jgi:hypothetical protein